MRNQKQPKRRSRPGQRQGSAPRTAYSYPQEEFGNILGAMQLDAIDDAPLLNLMENALDLARMLRKGDDFGPGEIGCNYIMQRPDGIGVIGDFNIEALIAPGGKERAAAELRRRLQECGAVRYALYTTTRSSPEALPTDISVIGCEPGTTMAWVFNDADIAGAERPRPREVGNMVGWFTGLLDTGPASEEAGSTPAALAPVADLLKAADQHMSRCGSNKNPNALLFNGRWRERDDNFCVTFDNSLYEQTGLSQPLIVIGTNLNIAEARHAVLVEEVGHAPGTPPEVVNRGTVFRVSVLFKDRRPLSARFDTVRQSSGASMVMLRGNRAKRQWWDEVPASAPALANLLQSMLAIPHDETIDSEELLHSTEVAERKMQWLGMEFSTVRLAGPASKDEVAGPAYVADQRSGDSRRPVSSDIAT